MITNQRSNRDETTNDLTRAIDNNRPTGTVNIPAVADAVIRERLHGNQKKYPGARLYWIDMPDAEFWSIVDQHTRKA